MLDTSCPQCGAPHARKLSVIHSEGISTVKTEVNTVGTLNTIGRQKIKTTGTTTGVQQTQASKDAAKPVVPGFTSSGRVIQGVLVFVGLLSVVLGLIAGTGVMAIIGVLIAFAALLVNGEGSPEEIAAYNERTKEVRERAAMWEKTFQCGACGERFVPIEA